MKKRWRVLCAALSAAVALIALFSFVYAGTVVVDSFDEGDEDYTVDQGSCGSDVYAHASILGGERDSELCVGGTNRTTLQVDYSGSNKLQVSANDGAIYTATLVWDGQDNDATSVDYTGLGGYDLISDTNDGFLLTVLTKDQGNVGVTFEVYNSSANWSTSTLLMPSPRVNAGERVDLFFPFSDFQTAGGTGADFNSAGAIVLRFDGTYANATDISVDVLETRSMREYGDLPVAIYGTSVLSATHVPGGLRLGLNLDTESTYNSSTDADGDDGSDTPDDEDGVVPSFFDTPGDDYWYADVTVTGCPDNSCYLNGWIDLNSNGFFTDTGEHFINDQSGGDSGLTGQYLINDTTVIDGGNYYLRFRVCEEAGACDAPDTSDTDVRNGEVEDYRWTLDPTAITLTDITARSSTLYAALGAVALVAVGLMGAVVILRRRRA